MLGVLMRKRGAAPTTRKATGTTMEPELEPFCQFALEMVTYPPDFRRGEVIVASSDASVNLDVDMTFKVDTTFEVDRTVEVVTGTVPTRDI